MSAGGELTANAWFTRDRLVKALSLFQLYNFNKCVIEDGLVYYLAQESEVTAEAACTTTTAATHNRLTIQLSFYNSRRSEQIEISIAALPLCTLFRDDAIFQNCARVSISRAAMPTKPTPNRVFTSLQTFKLWQRNLVENVKATMLALNVSTSLLKMFNYDDQVGYARDRLYIVAPRLLSVQIGYAPTHASESDVQIASTLIKSTCAVVANAAVAPDESNITSLVIRLPQTICELNCPTCEYSERDVPFMTNLHQTIIPIASVGFSQSYIFVNGVIKVLRQTKLTHQLMEREFTVMKLLRLQESGSKRYIPEVYSFGTNFIITEYAGAGLDEIRAAGKPAIRFDGCFHIAIQVAHALSFLHAQRIIFMDLNEANVGCLLTDDNTFRIKLRDFSGHYNSMEGMDGVSSALKYADTPITPQFCSPERFFLEMQEQATIEQLDKLQQRLYYHKRDQLGESDPAYRVWKYFGKCISASHDIWSFGVLLVKLFLDETQAWQAFPLNSRNLTEFEKFMLLHANPKVYEVYHPPELRIFDQSRLFTEFLDFTLRLGNEAPGLSKLDVMLTMIEKQHKDFEAVHSVCFDEIRFSVKFKCLSEIVKECLALEPFYRPLGGDVYGRMKSVVN